MVRATLVGCGNAGNSWAERRYLAVPETNPAANRSNPA
jgi:hypothetical protein